MNKLDELKKELEKVKERNRALWDMYGSELCAEDLISSERRLQKEITELENKNI